MTRQSAALGGAKREKKMEDLVKVVLQVRTKGAGLCKWQTVLYLNAEMTQEERVEAIHHCAAKVVEVWHAEVADDESLSNVSDWQALKA